MPKGILFYFPITYKLSLKAVSLPHGNRHREDGHKEIE